MTHVVQFTKWIDFIDDLAAGETSGIYHELIEQRTASSQHGYSRWLLTTIIRAIVANGSQTHVAALTIPHGPQVEHLNGAIFGPPGAEENEERRWREAREAHEMIIDDLARLLHKAGIPMELIRGGIVNVPADLPFVLASIDEEKGQTMTFVTSDHPDWGLLQEVLEEQRRAEADAAGEIDFSPGGDGSPD